MSEHGCTHPTEFQGAVNVIICNSLDRSGQKSGGEQNLESDKQGCPDSGNPADRPQKPLPPAIFSRVRFRKFPCSLHKKSIKRCKDIKKGLATEAVNPEYFSSDKNLITARPGAGDAERKWLS